MNPIARRRVEKTFAQLSRGEWSAATEQMTADVHHVFPGDHPLGGERRSRDAVLRWFERLGRLYPGHAYLDTQAIERACRRMAEAGVEEAAAAPIVD